MYLLHQETGVWRHQKRRYIYVKLLLLCYNNISKMYTGTLASVARDLFLHNTSIGSGVHRDTALGQWPLPVLQGVYRGVVLSDTQPLSASCPQSPPKGVSGVTEDLPFHGWQPYSASQGMHRRILVTQSLFPLLFSCAWWEDLAEMKT